MKHKFLFLLIAAFCFACNNSNLSSDINSNICSSEEISSDKGELKEAISIYKYYSYDMLTSNKNSNAYSNGFAAKFLNSEPSFHLAGDLVRMEYYGEVNEVIRDDVSISGDNDSNIGISYMLNGEIESIEYIRADVNKATCERIYDISKERYVFKLDEYVFDYVLIDYSYRIILADDYLDDNFEVYVSYYQDIPQAIYSFDPMENLF